MTPSGAAPLAGITVVEAATFLSGPLAAQALADLGAQVVKVEPPGGDAFRRFGRTVEGLSVMWVAANRSKAAAVVDLATAEGRAEMDRLLDTADVLITNWRPGVAERLGLDADRVRGRWPRLVWCRISGFGQDGPKALEPAFDGVVQAASGTMPTQGFSPAGGGAPQMVRAFQVDKLTAAYAAQATLAALLARATSGAGAVVDVAMLDAAAYFNFTDSMIERALPADDGHGDGINRQLATVQAVPTADGWIMVSPARARQMRAAVEAAGHPEWTDELRRAGDPDSLTARFFELLATVTPQRTTAEWLEVLRAADVPAAEVLDADGHLSDPQVVHNGVYQLADHPTIGRHRWVRYPARFS
ncbi:CoA transferase [Acidiferrimicrobium sp. IK]|uniref:CaiB/BaiF CoA transferase family protein n=1 Tax=Acidiferrimicrobium sp. IK TaxID=2871700 RepID=UPI0021CB4D15|nr:CoA transferase [Acidiferrimicrobium sp. IK]MCU4183576.1 CoA transferase [Acidiferrimicrobium sp. IK]